MPCLGDAHICADCVTCQSFLPLHFLAQIAQLTEDMGEVKFHWENSKSTLMQNLDEKGLLAFMFFFSVSSGLQNCSPVAYFTADHICIQSLD